MLFGLEAADLLLILILGVVLFGPEKLPIFARKAARVFVYLRDIANNAKTTLRTELGPEYADLELKDLHPKAFIAKHLREEVALIEETRRDLQDASKMLKDSTKEMESAAKDAAAAGTVALENKDDDAEPQLALAAPASSPFDSEAT